MAVTWYQYFRLASIHQLIWWWHIVWYGCGCVHPHRWIEAFLLIQCLLPYGFTHSYGSFCDTICLVAIWGAESQLDSLLMYWVPKSVWICLCSPYSDNILVKCLDMVLAVMLLMSVYNWEPWEVICDHYTGRKNGFTQVANLKLIYWKCHICSGLFIFATRSCVRSAMILQM